MIGVCEGRSRRVLATMVAPSLETAFLSQVKAMALSDDALDMIFRTARTMRAWTARPVSNDTLHAIYELVKWGPTSSNICPARIVFVTTPEGKARLEPALDRGNVKQTMAAPATAIIAYDLEFYEKLP